MNTKMSLRILQILLGVVLFLYSAELVIEQLHADHHSPAFFALLILGSVEAVAAVVFLFATPIGGPALLVTFAGGGDFSHLARTGGGGWSTAHLRGGGVSSNERQAS